MVVTHMLLTVILTHIVKFESELYTFSQDIHHLLITKKISNFFRFQFLILLPPVTAHKNQFGKLIAQARERMKKSNTKSPKSASQSSQDSSPDTMGTETLSSLPQDASQDVANTKEDAPCSDLNPKEDTNDKDDVVIEEDNTNEVRIMDLGLPSVSKRKDGKKKRKRLGKLVSDGRSREQEIQDGVSQESDLELSERRQKLKPGRLVVILIIPKRFEYIQAFD